MTQRITNAQIDALNQRINAELRDDLRVLVERRYGYTAIDLYDRHGCVRTLSTGMTKQQTHDYLSAMCETLSIVGRDV